MDIKQAQELEVEVDGVNNFKKIFGNPEEVIICIGDWEQKKQMKFKELIKRNANFIQEKNYKVF